MMGDRFKLPGWKTLCLRPQENDPEALHLLSRENVRDYVHTADASENVLSLVGITFIIISAVPTLRHILAPCRI